MGDGERERRDRRWRIMVRGVLVLLLLTTLGMGVWFIGPPRLELELVLEALDGTSQEVRCGDQVLGTSPVSLDLEQLKALARPEHAQAFAARSTGPGSVSYSTNMEVWPGGRMEFVAHAAEGEPCWLHLVLTGTREELELMLPLELGPPGALYQAASHGQSGSSLLRIHDRRHWIGFSAP